jgi:hypothetical protein
LRKRWGRFLEAITPEHPVIPTVSGTITRLGAPGGPKAGRQLLTLEDAGNYITKLPKAEHTTAELQAATEALIMAAEAREAADACADRRQEGDQPAPLRR